MSIGLTAPLSWRSLTGAIATALALLLAGCAGNTAPAWHPVTTEESQLLAVSRFQNFDAGTRSFETTLTVQGQTLSLQGSYNFEDHIGYAAVTGKDFDPQAMLWNDSAVALRPQQPGPSGDPLPQIPDPADQGWNLRALTPTASLLDSLLAAISLLGTDRPDNPLLVQQAGALWLGPDTSDSQSAGGDLQLFAGPPSDEPLKETDAAPIPDSATVRYALDKTGLMHRVELRLGEGWVTVNLHEGDAGNVPIALAHTLLAQPDTE